MAEVATLTLANVALDLQISICMFLHPSDILSLRKTSKAFEITTRKRVVWMAALYRVCLDNTLFLPSFPIPDMSDLELEQAAIAPYRWIGLCAAYEKQHLNDPGALLCPRTTRIIKNSRATVVNYPVTTELFIVPGGRYLVSSSPDGIFVWDLGYSPSADCKLIASVGQEGGSYCCMVQATPDGMGLTIFSSNAYENCSIYEIYPQTETPHLTQIAHLDFDSSKDPPAYLLNDTVTWYGLYGDRIVFRVWDYRVNYSVSFSVDVDVDKLKTIPEVIATKTALIVLCEEEILVSAIPPLSPHPPDFFDHNPTHIPPLFRIPFPEGILPDTALSSWNTISSWYFGSSQPLYFDMLFQDSIRRFQIIIKPDLSDASIQVINASEFFPHAVNHVTFQSYRICEDTLVSWWSNLHVSQCGIYTGFTSARFANIISPGGPAAKMSFPGTAYEYYFSLCPASGRLVHLDKGDNSIVVLDLF